MDANTQQQYAETFHGLHKKGDPLVLFNDKMLGGPGGVESNVSGQGSRRDVFREEMRQTRFFDHQELEPDDGRQIVDARGSGHL